MLQKVESDTKQELYESIKDLQSTISQIKVIASTIKTENDKLNNIITNLKETIQ